MANIAPNTPPQVSPIYASNFTDWATPLMKAGVSVTAAPFAIMSVTQMPDNMDTDSIYYDTWAKAIQGALKSNGYPVKVDAKFTSVENAVLTRQFNANWHGTMTWGALLLGALAAPMYTGPDADVGSVIKSNLPLILIGGAAVAYLVFGRK
jgi:hypothetical protein